MERIIRSDVTQVWGMSIFAIVFSYYNVVGFLTIVVLLGTAIYNVIKIIESNTCKKFIRFIKDKLSKRSK